MSIDKPIKIMKNKEELLSMYLHNVMIDFDNEYEIEKLKQFVVKLKKIPKKPRNKL